MSGDFLDSNVFVYMFTGDDRRAVAREIVAYARESSTSHVSFQVVQETLNVLTTKITVGLRPEDATEFARATLLPIWTVMPSLALYEAGLRLKERYGFHFYDSLIVAAALEAGCDRLISEDFQHGQRIDGLTVYNPFL